MTMENYTDNYFWKPFFSLIGIAIVGSLGYNSYKSIETGEWNRKKRQAIYYEFNKLKENQNENKKDYFDWASKSLDMDNTYIYETRFGSIRGKLGIKNIDRPLFVDDFKKYLEICEKNNLKK